MDRRKPRPSTEVEVAAVKAAAWAWYERGSGNEGKHVHEFELVRSTRAPRPSRYKLEALRASAPDPIPAPITESSNSLLDVYEIDRITRELDRLISSCRQGGRCRGNEEMEKGKRVARSNRVSGLWVRHAVGICGARGDVVEAVVGRRRRGRPGEPGSFGFGAL